MVSTMKNNSEAEYLLAEVERNIKTLKKKVKRQKLKNSVVNGLSMILGAAITLILGFNVHEDYASLQKNSALVVGAMLTIVNSWNIFSNYKKLWVRQKSTLLNLYQLKNELGYRTSKQTDVDFQDLFEKYQKIWEKDRAEWRGIVTPVQIHQSKNDLKNKA